MRLGRFSTKSVERTARDAAECTRPGQVNRGMHSCAYTRYCRGAGALSSGPAQGQRRASAGPVQGQCRASAGPVQGQCAPCSLAYLCLVLKSKKATLPLGYRRRRFSLFLCFQSQA